MEWLHRLTIRLVLASMIVLLMVLGHRAVQTVEFFRGVDDNHRRLKDQVEMLSHDIGVLTEERQRLATDYSYYEQLSRESFGMIKEDEVVYIVKLP